MSNPIMYTDTLALFGLHVMLCNEQSKCPKHWDNYLSHCTVMRPTLIIPEKTAKSTAEKMHADHKIALDESEKDLTKQEEWDLDDQKVLGIITLKISQNFSYFIKDTALETWIAIKKAFDSAGAAAIYADYKAAITFKMDPREDPALEISKLQTILERLVSKRLPMNDMV